MMTPALRSGLWNLALIGSVLGYLIGTGQVSAQSPPAPTAAAFDGEREFLEVWTAVRDRFYRSDLNGVDWNAARERYLPRARQAKSLSELSPLINELLGLLNTSHTAFFTRHDPEYFYLCDLFFSFLSEDPKFAARFPEGKVQVEGIGLLCRRIENQWFAAGVLDGSPAAEAGIHRGNLLVAANGQPFQPVESFRGQAGQAVELLVQSTSDPASQRRVTVTPTLTGPQDSMLAALNASLKIVERNQKKIGYLHIWSYAGKQFQERLVQEATQGLFQSADALIIDIRDGWGGASPEYLSLFNQAIPQLSGFDRRGERPYPDTQWRKPVALLINGGSRSGKEVIAYGFRKYQIGTVIGERTAGAVSAGTVIPIGQDSLLYLCVSGVRVDGEILEGAGVAPDVEVPYPLPFGTADDPQLERALKLLGGG